MTNKSPPGGFFIKMTHALVDSTTFAAASSHAKSLLIFLWRRHNGRNNGHIHCSVREAAAWLHSSKSTAARTFTELETRRLIEPVQLGHFTIKAGDAKSEATTWRLLVIPEDGVPPPSNQKEMNV